MRGTGQQAMDKQGTTSTVANVAGYEQGSLRTKKNKRAPREKKRSREHKEKNVRPAANIQGPSRAVVLYPSSQLRGCGAGAFRWSCPPRGGAAGMFEAQQVRATG